MGVVARSLFAAVVGVLGAVPATAQLLAALKGQCRAFTGPAGRTTLAGINRECCGGGGAGRCAIRSCTAECAALFLPVYGDEACRPMMQAALEEAAGGRVGRAADFVGECTTSTVPLSEIQGTCDGGTECITSPYSGQTVTVAGTVVGVVDVGFFLNDDSGYGVYVYEHDFHPTIGDLVQLSAQVSEYHDLTELSRVADPVVLSSGNPLPRPMAVVTGELGERHEGLLVSVQAVSAASSALRCPHDCWLAYLLAGHFLLSL